MQYAKGHIGKILTIRFDHNEDILDGIKTIVKKEKIAFGSIMMIGALNDPKIVAGPKEPVIPPIPQWVQSKNAWEIIGMGNIVAPKKADPEIHLHVNIGRNKNTHTGCLRNSTKAFLFVEAIIHEIKDINAKRVFDKSLGLKKLEVKNKK